MPCQGHGDIKWEVHYLSWNSGCGAAFHNYCVLISLRIRLPERCRTPILIPFASLWGYTLNIASICDQPNASNAKREQTWSTSHPKPSLFCSSNLWTGTVAYWRSTLLADYQRNHHFEVVLLYIFSYHWARIIDNNVIEMSDDITDGVFHETSR